LNRTHRETEQYAKREEVWNQIEELARKKNPNFEGLINQMDYLALNNNHDGGDYTINEDDFSSDKLDQYSSVSWCFVFSSLPLQLFQSLFRLATYATRISL